MDREYTAQYTSLSEIGLVKGSETMAAIATNLTEDSVIKYAIDGTYNISAYPYLQGEFTANKISNIVTFTFNDEETHRFWNGISMVDPNSGNFVWSGWEQGQRTEVYGFPTPTYNQFAFMDKIITDLSVRAEKKLISVDTQLLNKVNKDNKSIGITNCNDLEAGWAHVDDSLSNVPMVGFNGTILTSRAGSHITQTAIHNTYERKMFFRDYGNGTWNKWQRLATAEPPQKHMLVLMDGFQRVNAAEYWKNQESEVTVTFRITRNDQIIPAGTYQVATLPEGFRPLSYVAHAVGTTIPSVNGGTPVISIGSNGVVSFQTPYEIPSSYQNGFIGTIVFLAG